MVLDRTAILGVQDRRIETVDVPEWGGEVNIGIMSGAQRDAFDALVHGDGRISRAALVLSFALDVDGNQLFTEADIPALNAKSHKGLDQIIDAGLRLNGLTADSIEELEKNSDGPESDDNGLS